MMLRSARGFACLSRAHSACEKNLFVTSLVVMYKMHQLLRFCLSMTKDNFEMFLSCTEASSAIFCGTHNVFIAFLIMHLTTDV